MTRRATVSSIDSTRAATPTVETGSGRPPTATISTTLRALSGSSARRPATTASSVTVALAVTRSWVELRTSSSIRKGLPSDSCATTSAICCAARSSEPNYLLAYTWDPGNIRSLEDILNNDPTTSPSQAKITTLDCEDGIF